MSAKGLQCLAEYTNPRTRYKILRYVILHEFQEQRLSRPEVPFWSTYQADSFADLGFGATDIQRAQQELSDLGLLELHERRSDLSYYNLTVMGQRACANEQTIENLLEGNDVSHPPPARDVYNVANHLSVGHGQVIQNTGPGTVSVSQGGITFGASVLASQQEELRRMLTELRASIDETDLATADREDAQEALAKVVAELGKSEPERSRLRRSLATLAETAGPFEKFARITAQVAAALQASGLLG